MTPTTLVAIWTGLAVLITFPIAWSAWHGDPQKGRGD